MTTQANSASNVTLGFLGAVLIAIGIWASLAFLPTTPILSPTLLVLISGLGVFIGYRQKRTKTRWVFLAGFWIASWVFFFYALFSMLKMPALSPKIDGLFSDYMAKAFPIVALGTLPFAWFGRWKSLGHTALKNLIGTYVIYLLIIVPFPYAIMNDYNVRADTSPPEVITVKIVHKNYDDEMGCSLMIETLDGKSSCWMYVYESFYREHDWYSLIEVRVRRGALGYTWVEGIAE